MAEPTAVILELPVITNIIVLIPTFPTVIEYEVTPGVMQVDEDLDQWSETSVPNYIYLS